MNYIGSKRKLSEWVFKSIKDRADLTGEFLDGFGGTSIIAQTLKPYMHVTVNDVEAYAYWLGKHYIEGDDSYAELIRNLSEAPGVEGFIYNNYCKTRMYWTPENGKKIDGIRIAIEHLQLNDKQKAAALCALLEAADKVANTASVYGAYLKAYKSTAKNSIALQAIQPPSGISGQAINKDILDLKLSGDIAYLDPPYNARHYGSNYHLLNTICNYTEFEPKGITGLPDYYKSPFCSKVKCVQAMNQLLDSLDYKHIFISYNDEGIIPMSKLQEICANAGDYELIQTDYQRFKSDSKREQKQDSTVEYIHYIKR